MDFILRETTGWSRAGKYCSLAYVLKIPLSTENIACGLGSKASSHEAVPAVSREMAVVWSRVSAVKVMKGEWSWDMFYRQRKCVLQMMGSWSVLKKGKLRITLGYFV